MSAHDVKLFGDQIAASRLETRFARLKAFSLLRLAIEDLYPGRIALVSSFGADAVALLHMVAQIDAATPVIFVDTGQHFPETLAYRDALCETLKLTNVIVAAPDADALAAEDPGEVPVRQRIRTAAAKFAKSVRSRKRWRVTTPGSRDEKASGADDARDAAVVRGGRRTGQDQSAGRLERFRRSDLRQGSGPAASSLGRERVPLDWLPSVHQPVDPARTSAPAAGAAAARRNAASMSARSTRGPTSDAGSRRRRLRRGPMDACR